jgi:hypothetical protein
MPFLAVEIPYFFLQILLKISVSMGFPKQESQKGPFFATGKTLMLIYFLELTSNGVILHEVERVVFACRLPADRRKSILGQRGGEHLYS